MYAAIILSILFYIRDGIPVQFLKFTIFVKLIFNYQDKINKLSHVLFGRQITCMSTKLFAILMKEL
jgi:hypothetical protein